MPGVAKIVSKCMGMTDWGKGGTTFPVKLELIMPL